MEVSPEEQPTINFSSDPPMKRPPPPPPMTEPISVPVRRAVPSENAQMYAANLQLQAEVQGIREEMQRQERLQRMQAEIQRRSNDANATPAKQIVNHYQTIVNPPLPTPAVPISDGGMTAFQQALMQNNHTLGKTLERMGMSMSEFVEHMKEKDKKAVRDPIIADGGLQHKPEIIPAELIPVDPAPPAPPDRSGRCSPDQHHSH